MATQLQQPYSDSDVQRFYQFLQHEQRNTDSQSPIPCAKFVPHSSLRDFIGQQDRGFLRRLLKAILGKETDSQEIDEIRENYLRVLATLISIGHAVILPWFTKYKYTDKRLPFDSPPQDFPELPDVNIFTAFDACQWQFWPQRFHKGFYGHLKNERILPVLYKKKLKQSAPATIYKVVLHHDYDHLREEDSTSDKSVRASKNLQHTYVFKEYRGAHALDAFTKERTAFMHLRASQQLGKTIIGYYGYFSHNDSHVLILEYADQGTLDEFFKRNDAPAQGSEIMKLWRSLLAIQKALCSIHGISPEALDYPSQFKDFSALRGWHSDLKPANILVVSGPTKSPYDCEFRLADLGTSNFAMLAHLGYSIHAPDEGGTREFGAPESYLSVLPNHRPLTQPQKADIWSLGCIYSEFAVWIVLGKGALHAYQGERAIEIERRRIQHVSCFHDGERPLECVHRWNHEASVNKRESDHVTRSILDRLVKEMLYLSPAARPTAEQLVVRTQEILKEADMKTAHAENYHWFGSDNTTQHGQKTDHIETHRKPLNDPPGSSSSSSSGSSSDLSIPTDRPPLRKGGASGSHNRPTNDPLDTARFGTDHFRTPEKADTGHGTRDTTPIHTALSPKSIQSLERSPLGLETPSESMKYSTDVTRSPEVISVPQQHLAHEDVEPSVLPGAIVHDPNGKTHTNTDSEALGKHHVIKPIAKPMPSLNIDRALIYYRDKKAGRFAVLEDEGYLSLLQQPERDFIFLIDDARSMKPHAKRVCETVQFLAYVLKDYDKDGLEMYFMRAKGKFKSQRDRSSQLMQPLRDALRECQGTSDITHRLGEILHGYKERLTLSRQPKRLSLSFGEIFQSSNVKPLSIYILTDGEWQEESNPSKLIINTAQFLNDFGAQDIQLGIQFISFGDDPRCITKLEQLDSELPAVRDMVDTESINGNVFKMLLGSISRLWDGDRHPQNGV